MKKKLSLDKTNRRVLFCWLGAFLALIWISLFRVFCRGNDLTFAIFHDIMIFFFYILMIVLWGVSLYQRIMHRGVRFYLLLTVLAMAFWILLRTVKFTLLPGDIALSRYCWYGYYLPLLSMALFGYFAAHCIGETKRSSYGIPQVVSLTVTLVLILAIFTNDFHQLAFAFPDGIAAWRDYYTRGVLYYITVLWLLFMAVMMLWQVNRVCRIPGIRRRVLLPLGALGAGIFYTVLYIADASRFGIIEMSAMLCFVIASFWESCIQMGIIPSNRRYVELFESSTVAARIVDERYRLCYCSAKSGELSVDMMRRAVKEPFLLNDTTRLQSARIGGGHVIWLDDVSSESLMLQKHKEAGERLSGEITLLQAEMALKQKKTRIEEEKRLFEQIEKETSNQLQTLITLLQLPEFASPGFDQKLALACVIGAYIKRRSNLLLLGEGTPSFPCVELEYCIRESVGYLQVYGVAASFHRSIEGNISSEHAKLIYDFFEAVIESALPGMTSLLVNMAAKKDILLKITVDRPTRCLPLHWRRESILAAGAIRSVNHDGDTAFFTLWLPRGGEKK